ncbi:NAC domain-containing protein 1 [Raphanus sativus]|nr:NAC domain-containing protein 1 [Raphanus sativus]
MSSRVTISFTKILGNHNLVDGVIKEIVNICSFDPWDLRWFMWSNSSLEDQIERSYMVFHIPRENNGSKQNRTTRSGYWKLTGLQVDVKDQWGHLTGVRGKKIGHKRVLTFHSWNNQESSSNSSENNKSAAWVMHELHYTHTDLPEHKRMSYVVCRLEYKGDDENILSADPTFAPTMANSANSVVDQGNSGYNNTFADYQDQQFGAILEYALPNQSDWNQDDQQYRDWHTQKQLEYLETKLMEDPSRHRPKKPLSGTNDSMSDSDTDSMNGRDAWSSTDSVGSTDAPYHTPKDDTPSLSEPLYNREAQEQPKQLELQLQGKEKVMNKQKSECEFEDGSRLDQEGSIPYCGETKLDCYGGDES